MGSNDRLNQVVLQKVISTRKMELIEELQIMDSKDVLLYKNWLRKSTCFWTPKKPYVKRLLKKAL